MIEEVSLQEFKSIKEKILSACDLSKKGSIDSDIVDLVQLINSSPHYVTTSSCSGRIILFSKSGENAKAGCQWVLVIHDFIDVKELITKIQENKDKNLVIKFEPFIMHISCRTLHDTKIIQDSALNAGYRNSGMVLGKKGRITFAIRSTHNLEVPICNEGDLMVSKEYIQYLASLCNNKMTANKERIKKLENICRSAFNNLSEPKDKL